MIPSDWPDVSRIYRQGLETGNATFETTVPTWESWDSGHLDECRLVLEIDDDVVGWVALSPVSSRPVYRGVVEHSIYIAEEARGTGAGAQLLGSLVLESENAGFWTLQTSIFPENEASIALHAKHGFRVVGTRERIGSHRGRWRDTVLMERRSTRMGV
jgi:L-amino acid N-acyltransferase YncA